MEVVSVGGMAVSERAVVVVGKVVVVLGCGGTSSMSRTWACMFYLGAMAEYKLLPHCCNVLEL